MKFTADYYESETIDTTVPKYSLEQQQVLSEQQQQQQQAPSTASSSSKPQQCLRFAPTMTIVQIPSRSDYTAAEMEASWFQAHDYADFREESYMTLGLCRAGLILEDNEKHCMRGLEGRLEDASRERGWLRHHATAAVFNEQYQQFHRCYHSPERIAEAYHAVTWKAQYAAYTKAMLDEQHATPAPTTHSATISCTKTATTKMRRSEAQNVLRKVIDIERSCVAVDHALACGLQQQLLQGEESFDVNSFFSDLTMAAQ